MSVDLYRINGPGGCTHAIAADIAFQCRSRSSGTCYQPLVVSNDQFPIGANIKKEIRFFPLMNTKFQQTADNIAAYIVGCSGDKVEQSFKIHAQLVPPKKTGICRDGSERCSKDGPGIESKKEMDHGGIAGYHHNRTLGSLNAGRFR